MAEREGVVDEYLREWDVERQIIVCRDRRKGWSIGRWRYLRDRRGDDNLLLFIWGR